MSKPKKPRKPAKPKQPDIDAPQMNAEQKALWDKLSPMRRRMAPHLLAGTTVTEAYRRAKGAEPGNRKEDTSTYRTAAKKCADHPSIAAWLDAMQLPEVSAAIMTRNEALEKLTILARTSLADLVEFGEYQVGVDDKDEPVIQATWKIKNRATIGADKLAVISELSAGRDGIKIKTHSPLAAIKQLGELQGWEAPKVVDHKSTDGTMTPAKEISDEQLKEKLRELGIGRKSGQLDERSE